MSGFDGRIDGPNTPHAGSTRSEVSGNAQNVVQARDISGGVHFHHTPQARSPVPRQLPGGIRDFVGRGSNIAALDRLLPSEGAAAYGAGEPPRTVVITAIDGAAGIGKTTLAVTWAHRVRERFPDGTLYANLRGYGPGEPARPGVVLEGFLRALGVRASRIPLDVEERATLYRSVLDARRVLVVLDNANTAEQVRPLLPAGSGCLALITSRSSLMGLAIGQGAVRISLDLLPLDEAVHLLRQIVGVERAEAEARSLEGLAQACARLPLALRVVGQRAVTRPQLTLADIMEELADQRARLDVLSSTGDESTAVRTVFDWSYRTLSTEQACMFRTLGLHPGAEIDVYAAAALADEPLVQARRVLEALSRVHLVEPSARDRYGMHDLLRAYARERAEHEDSADDRFAATERLLGFYLHAGEAGRRALDLAHHTTTVALPAPRYLPTFSNSTLALEWFKSEYSNIATVSRHAFENGLFLLSFQITGTLGGLFDYIGRRDEWIELFGKALAAATALGDRDAQGTAHDGLGVMFHSLRSYEQSLEHHTRALEIARADGHRFGEARSLNGLGNAFRGLNQYSQAEACFKQAMNINHELGFTSSAAISLANIGLIFRDQRRYDEAMQAHSDARDLFQQKGDKPHESWILRVIGDTHFVLGRIDAAVESHRRALDIARQLGLGRQEARILVSLGDDLHRLGETVEARACWSDALAIYDTTGDVHVEDVRARLAGSGRQA